MAATEPSTKPKHKLRSDKKTQASQSAAVDKLKTVVRRLPPNLPEDIFWQSVQPWVTDESASWRAFYPGKFRKKYNKDNVPSRAYVAFRSAEQLAAFSQAYDGHVFRDKSGNESFAVVEFAPSQKIPPEKRKVDTRMGTIEQDEDYLSFLATLSAPTSKPSESDTLEALIASSQLPQQPKSTPLLDALRAEKQAQRDRETILKAHAHYRDRDKEDLGTRRRGKQPLAAPPLERDEHTPVPGQGKRNRRGGGKKGEAPATTATPKAKDKEATPAGSTKAVAKAPPKPTSPQVLAVSAKEGAKDAPQESRARPAIKFGLASRQFEAALSGAGVITGGGPDRKPRRERERERKASEVVVMESTQKLADKEMEKVDKPQTPASPGKERARGNRKRGDSAKSITRPAAASVIESNSGAAPVIITSSGSQFGILARPTAAPSAETPTSVPAPGGAGSKPGGGSPLTLGEGRGGRRRGGRARGTPRGGAPVGDA